MKTLTALSIATAALLGGCIGPNPQMDVIKVAELDAATVSHAQRVQVLPAGYQPGMIRSTLGMVNATSCKNKTWDPPPTRGDATMQLRVKAAAKGANAIANVTYDEQGTDAWGTNCWSSITASADAILLK